MIVRLSISVSDELKAEMDQIETRVNWSAVAQSAFTREIALQKPIGVDDMDQVVERLRISKETTIDKQISLGRNYGAEWAQKRAQYTDLRSLAEIAVDDLSEDDSRWNLRVFTDAMWGREYDPKEVMDFCENALGEKEPSAAEIKGFIWGAQDVWDEVAEKL